MKLAGSTAKATEQFAQVRKWLMMVLVNNVFGGASDNALREVRLVLRSSSDEFAVDAMNDKLAAIQRQTRFDQYGS